jgi:hypothetical protein
MKNVIIVNGDSKKCGIFQYGESAYMILKTSPNYDYHFLATNSEEHLHSSIEHLKPCAVIYNHHPETLKWLHNGITRPIANNTKIKQIVITGHESIKKFIGINSYIITDPYAKCGENEYAGVPPIPYDDRFQYSKPECLLKIGTSGISNITKSPIELINLINDQFNEDIILNLHVSDGDFVDSTGALSNSILDTYQKNAKSNIHINVTNKFLTPSELVAWLNNNDINLYWYNTPNVPGVSGSIDRALAAKKPFGVNSSSFFSHVRRDFNDINKVSIKTIIENGIEPFNQFYDMWSSENLIKFYESIIESC